ncbi:MAG: cytochrome c oxidase assembly protein [Gallionellaceae bacterium]|nr:cytochrome c oxidase assembly protein [Gallionellaceae bacterium]
MDEDIRQANRKLVKKLLLAVAAASVFGFAMVPFYDALCKITGLNGKTGGAASAQTVQARKIDTSRFVTVELNGNTMQGLSWEFGANQNKLRVHPGEIVMTAFHVKNPTNQALMGQAVPSVSPGWTAQYFNKIECFCFKQQTLNPGESKEMPLTFFVSPELPKDVKEIALSYAFFPIGNGS